MIPDGEDDAGAANDGAGDDGLLPLHAVSVATAAAAAAAELRIEILPLL